jgi:hypothetical protein
VATIVKSLSIRRSQGLRKRIRNLGCRRFRVHLWDIHGCGLPHPQTVPVSQWLVAIRMSLVFRVSCMLWVLFCWRKSPRHSLKVSAVCLLLSSIWGPVKGEKGRTFRPTPSCLRVFSLVALVLRNDFVEFENRQKHRDHDATNDDTEKNDEERFD